MFREVLTFLASDGWPVAPDTFDGLPCIRTRFIGTEEAWDCRARAYDPFGQLAFESILPMSVAPEYRSGVVDLLVRANWRLLTGAFLMDLDTGDMVFRTMLFLPDGVEVSPSLLRGLVYSNVLTVDRCLSEFRIAAAGGSPRETFDRLRL